MAPSLKLSYDSEELPISVKPDKPVAVTDVMALLRQTYEGTEWDMTKNLKVAVKNKETKETDTITSPAANPWMGTDMLNMLNGVKEGTVTRNRLVAVPQCSYSHVIQLRNWLPDAVGGVAWLSFDNPGQSRVSRSSPVRPTCRLLSVSADNTATVKMPSSGNTGRQTNWLRSAGD